MDGFDEKIKQLEVKYSQLNQQLQLAQLEVEKENENVADHEISYQIAKKNEQEALKEYDTERVKEVLNEYGISKNSELLLHIKKGENFKTKDLVGRGDPYVKVEFEGKTHKSEVLQNLQFDVQWKFKVKNPSSKLVINAMDSNIMSDDTTGSVTIDLQKYKDQNLHDEELTLTDKNKEAGKLHISLSFQWSNANKLKTIHEIAQQKTKEAEIPFIKAKQIQKSKKDQVSAIEAEILENRRKVKELQYKKQQNPGKKENEENDKETPRMQEVDLQSANSSQGQNKGHKKSMKGAMEAPKRNCGVCSSCNIL